MILMVTPPCRKSAVFLFWFKYWQSTARGKMEKSIKPWACAVVYSKFKQTLQKSYGKVAQLSMRSSHAVRWSFKLLSLCQSLFVISAHLEDVLTCFGWAHAVPFDYKQAELIVMIKRDLTHRYPSLIRARSYLASLSVDVCGCNEEASLEPISQSVITATVLCHC